MSNDNAPAPLLVVEGDDWVTLPSGKVLNLATLNMDAVEIDGGRIVACVGGQKIEIYNRSGNGSDKEHLQEVLEILVGTPPKLADRIAARRKAKAQAA